MDWESKKEVSLLRPGGVWIRGRKIGEGGFGSVHRAMVIKPKLPPHVLPTFLAVKSAPFTKSNELEYENFLLGVLFRDCPFIIRCHGEDITADVDGGKVFNMFLEFAEGGTVRDMVEKSGGSGLDESIVREYTGSILKGIHYIHSKGIVHCDIKPENVLLVAKTDKDEATSWSDFVPKIGDLGLAKRAFEKLSSRGTTEYLAPETVMQRIQEQPADIWALGCLVLEMLTGERPWELNGGAKPQEIMAHIASMSPTIPDWLSEDAKDFLGKCFVRKHLERSTAGNLLKHPFVTRRLVDAYEVGKVVDPLANMYPAAAPRNLRPPVIPMPLTTFTLIGAAY